MRPRTFAALAVLPALLCPPVAAQTGGEIARDVNLAALNRNPARSTPLASASRRTSKTFA